MADDKSTSAKAPAVTPQDKAAEKAFVAGTLPEKDRRAVDEPDAKIGKSAVNAATPAAKSPAALHLAEKSADAARETGEAKAQLSKAAEDAAPTGKDFPERATPTIEGHETAHNPDQPSRDSGNSRAQTEPAILARDGGSVPHGMVASPTGPVPASAVGPDAAVALGRHAEQLKVSEQDGTVSEQLLQAMNKHEIRSVAHDRGYKIGEGSQRSLVRRFLEAQEAAQSSKSAGKTQPR